MQTDKDFPSINGTPKKNTSAISATNSPQLRVAGVSASISSKFMVVVARR